MTEKTIKPGLHVIAGEMPHGMWCYTMQALKEEYREQVKAEIARYKEQGMMIDYDRMRQDFPGENIIPYSFQQLALFTDWSLNNCTPDIEESFLIEEGADSMDALIMKTAYMISFSILEEVISEFEGQEDSED